MKESTTNDFYDYWNEQSKKHTPEYFEDLDMADMQQIIPGLEKGSIAIFAAPSGTGKTFLAMQLAASCATGHNFWDWNNPQIQLIEEPIKTLYINLEEGKKHFDWRLKQILAKLEPEEKANFFANAKFITALDRIETYRSIFSTSELDSGRNLQNQKKLIEALQQLQIELVIIDTLSKVNQSEENSNSEMSSFFAAWHRIAAEAHCAIIFVHHFGKIFTRKESNKDYLRGASAIGDSARLVFSLEKGKEKEGYKINFLKSNDCAQPQSISLHREEGSGLFMGLDVKSIVISETEEDFQW